jgi:gliding motility-associated-like protein
MKKIVLLCLLCYLHINTNAQTASFSFSGSNGSVLCAPATVNFTQTCTGNPIGFTWSFGNGQTSNDANPIANFVTGNYTVKLVAVFENGPQEFSQNITVNNSITVNLSADKNYICLPGVINFNTTSSSNNATLQYNFGDGNTSNTNNNTISNNYANFGNYTATVLVTDTNGCTATASTNIEVKKPPIAANASVINGCAPLNTTAQANVTVPSGSNVSSYLWDFADGSTPFTTSTNTTTHNFLDSGTYNATVTITSSEGCSNTGSIANFAIGIPPTNSIAYATKNSYCGSETPVFIGKANFANSYQWNFGDGSTAVTSDTIISHDYETLGVKTITVTPFFNGCAGTPQTISISIVGVIANFVFSNTCSNKKTFSFTNTSQGNLSIINWSFGDGSANSALLNPVHSFPAQGNFTTLLSVTDNITGCSDVLSAIIFTANPSLINADNFLCRNTSTTFNINNNYNNTSASYTWNTLGTSITGAVPYQQVANNFGNFNTHTVVINNGANYCLDTIILNKLISVRGPQVGFTIPDSVCGNNDFIIQNTSTPYLAADAINTWKWYLINTKIDSVFTPSPKRIPAAGVYAIKLIATDVNNCTDSIIKNIRVKQSPFLRIFPRFDTLCQGRTDSLIAYHSDSLLWQPSNIVNCATCDTVITNPNSNTTLFAIASNNIGCSVRDSVLYTVLQPFTATALNNPTYVCIGDTTGLKVLPTNKIITWTPNTNLSNNNAYNPIATVQQSQVYTATLTDSTGCFSSNVEVSIVAKTLPIVNAGPDRTLPYLSSFTIAATYGNNVSSYLWSPATDLSCTNCVNPTGIAKNSQTYTVKATSDSGCVAKDDVTIFVECNNSTVFVPNAFSPNNDRKNDLFSVFARGVKRIKSFSIYNRMGQLLYQIQNVKPNEQKNGWDGNYKGLPQPQAVYVYSLEVECDKGNSIAFKNSFVLVR